MTVQSRPNKRKKTYTWRGIKSNWKPSEWWQMSRKQRDDAAGKRLNALHREQVYGIV